VQKQKECEMKTKGEIKAEISEALVRFEIEYTGRGPRESRSYMIEDMILARLQRVLTPAERQLAKNNDGIELVKKVRQPLIVSAKSHLSQAIGDIAIAKVREIHTDMSATCGKRVFVFILDRNSERELPRIRNS
jgi:uncharacterized protein YbcI